VGRFAALSGAVGITALGSQIHLFALQLWIHEESGSALAIGTVAAIAALPPLVLGPFVGALVDRLNRKGVIVASGLLVAVRAVTLGGLHTLGSLRVWHFYVLGAFGSIFDLSYECAFVATLALLVPRPHLGRCNSILEGTLASTAVTGPFIAAWIYSQWGANGSFFVDASMYVFAMGIYAMMRVPQPVSTAEERAQSIWRAIGVGWTHFRERPTLMLCALLVTLLSTTAKALNIALIPFVLALGGPAALALTMSGAAVGAISANVVLVAVSLPGRPLRVIQLALVGTGVALVVAGLAPTVWLLTAASAVMGAGLVVGSVAQTVEMQVSVPPEVQGRIFGLIGSLQTLLAPAAYLLGGGIADMAEAVAEAGWFGDHAAIDVFGYSVAVLGVVFAVTAIATTRLERGEKVPHP
jgi:MFS family permease